MTCRASGCEIMKMISSTSMMSIMGITLGSEVTWPETFPPPPAMSLLLLGSEEAAPFGFVLGHGGHDPDAGAAGNLHRLLDLRELQVLVGTEEQDLVVRTGGVD